MITSSKDSVRPQPSEKQIRRDGPLSRHSLYPKARSYFFLKKYTPLNTLRKFTTFSAQPFGTCCTGELILSRGNEKRETSGGRIWGKGEGCNTLNFHPPSLSLSFRPLLPLLLSHLEREEGRELFPPRSYTQFFIRMKVLFFVIPFPHIM